MPERLPERRRRRRPDLRKLMIVLPSLFTVSSIFCGVYSIMLSSGESAGDNFYRAAVAIFFGNFFDAFDGRVARMTKTQSDFGVELDSLADVITFGVAPAILVYKWALYGLGFAGIVIAAVYAACGAIRLARFNVLAHAESGVQRFFVGLPIPLAAGMLVSLVIALQPQRSPMDGFALWPIAVLVLVLSFLMVSTIRYRTFKDAGLNPRTLLIFVLVLALGVVVAYRGRPSLVLLVYFSVYILLGLGEELFFGRRRRAAAREREGGAGEPTSESESDEPILPAEEDDVALESAPATAGAATARAGAPADEGDPES
jgi:CDP-diacylglycerol--serine O-phosphatidyltransferase